MKPLLLVDVDGVLAPYGAHPDGYQLTRCGAVEYLLISPANRERLLQLAEAFDPVWATARFDDVAQTVARVQGVGEDWPVIPFERVVRRVGSSIAVVRMDDVQTWKLPFVNEWLARHLWHRRALAWIDDDLAADAKEWEEARERYARTCLIRVSPSTGLTDDIVKGLLEWAHGRR